MKVHRFETSKLPAWACLDCTPRWLDLHRLAAQELKVLVALETAFKWGDFEKTPSILHALKQLEREHSQETWAVLRELASDSLIGE